MKVSTICQVSQGVNYVQHSLIIYLSQSPRCKGLGSAQNHRIPYEEAREFDPKQGSDLPKFTQ